MPHLKTEVNNGAAFSVETDRQKTIVYVAYGETPGRSLRIRWGNGAESVFGCEDGEILKLTDRKGRITFPKKS